MVAQQKQDNNQAEKDLGILFAPRAVSIDKVKLQGHIDESKRVELLQHLSSMAYSLSRDKKITDKSLNVEYRPRVGGVVEVYLSFTSSVISLEFNPNRWTLKPERGLLFLMINKLQWYLVTDSWTIQRLDIAFDVYEDLSEMNIVIDRRLTREHWGSIADKALKRDKLIKINTKMNAANQYKEETYYFGKRSNKSDLIRIYDKHAAERDREVDPEVLEKLKRKHKHYWRIEFELHKTTDIAKMLNGDIDLLGGFSITEDYSYRSIKHYVETVQAKAKNDRYNYEVSVDTRVRSINRVVAEYLFALDAYLHGNSHFKLLAADMQREIKTLAKSLAQNSKNHTSAFNQQWEKNRVSIQREVRGYQSRSKAIVAQLIVAKTNKDNLNHELATTVTSLWEHFTKNMQLSNPKIAGNDAFVKRFNEYELATAQIGEDATEPTEDELLASFDNGDTGYSFNDIPD